MKLSARNQLKGRVTNVSEGVVNAKVTIDIGNGVLLTSMISMDAVKELELKVGSVAYAVIKASNVMVAVD